MDLYSFNNWPGKTDDHGHQLPAAVHMLDVMAVAEHLIDDHITFKHLSDAQRQSLLILIALHDIGKLSESFRSLIKDGKTGSTRHWQLSDFILRELDTSLIFIGASKYTRDELYAAVSGHHGQPPDRDPNLRYKRKKEVGEGMSAAVQWVQQLQQLYPQASLDGIKTSDAKIMSWILSGLTVAADWIGSNQKWFPINRPETSLANSRQRAKYAIQEAGLAYPKTSSNNIMQDIALRPAQRLAQDTKLQEGPQLIILEDSTGSGKTEAAMLLAHRMMAVGKAYGIFFALPTMATSDAMYDRLQNYVKQMFEEEPSVILTHSKSKLQYELSKADVTPETEWFMDNRRRAFLASVSVGTIDQALLGILPTKFATLRQCGLANKILIVDEAHSYDPYVQKELETLLRMQSAAGGSAILMTATLPLKMRQAYINAFQGIDKQTTVDNAEYPCLHKVGQEVISQPFLSHTSKDIKINRLSNEEQVVEFLSKASAEGNACVWIRNAVDDAINAKLMLENQGLNVDLLHARFTLGDRLDNEQQCIRMFGKDGIGRQGRILIATQVVEASLDLDFDIMVSDLAPIGSLIQRAGRLWRHERIRNTDAPVLHILSPDPDVVEDDKWLYNVLNKGAYVYRLDHQWLTAKTLFDVGNIISPDNLRYLIEEVHGEDYPDIPRELCGAQDEAIGQAMCETSFARMNCVDIDKGYLNGSKGAVSDDAVFPTRLSEEQMTLALMSSDGYPLISHESWGIAWALSEISISKRRFENLLPGQRNPLIFKVKKGWPRWKKEAIHICIVENGLIGEHIKYDNNLGLRSMNEFESVERSVDSSDTQGREGHNTALSDS